MWSYLRKWTSKVKNFLLSSASTVKLRAEFGGGAEMDIQEVLVPLTHMGLRLKWVSGS